MNSLWIGLLSALLSTNQPAALSNLVSQTTGIKIEVPDPNDPVEKEYSKLLADDDAAQEEVDKWIRDNQAFEQQGAGLAAAALNLRIEQRLQPVEKAYEEFLRQHPKHHRARLAFGSFLMDIGHEDESVVQMEKAREHDPRNPAAWNNLANHYGHRGPIPKAFEYYAQAIRLNPNEPTYHQNLATTVFLFRKDAMEFYAIDEQKVFDLALDHYRKALKLAPNDFPLATDLAQTYYGIKPSRTEEAMEAWNYALKVANDAIEREGVYVHLARLHLQAGRLDEARNYLNSVTNQMYAVLKGRLVRNINAKADKSKETDFPLPPSPKR